MASGGLERFLGGSASGVLVRLLFISLLVGAAMAFLELSPQNLLDSVVRFVRSITDLGFDAVYKVGGWLLAGALVVIPVWFILRLLKSR